MQARAKKTKSSGWFFVVPRLVKDEKGDKMWSSQVGNDWGKLAHVAGDVRGERKNASRRVLVLKGVASRTCCCGGTRGTVA
jgi:hypothetical protein